MPGRTNATRQEGIASYTNQKQSLKLDSELELSLSIIRKVSWRTLGSYLAKCTVAGITVRSVELGSVESVEVVHAEKSLYVLSDVEVLYGIEVFHG